LGGSTKKDLMLRRPSGQGFKKQIMLGQGTGKEWGKNQLVPHDGRHDACCHSGGLELAVDVKGGKLLREKKTADTWVRVCGPNDKGQRDPGSTTGGNQGTSKKIPQKKNWEL